MQLRAMNFYGQWMIGELARHGYAIGPGTLYPILDAMEREGYLKSKRQPAERTFRRVYRAIALPPHRNLLCFELELSGLRP